ncbi:flagellar biosynthesis chaperone FliJ [Rossellomorea marisflavi]|uniref:Flagellar FliJ protein n=2 Tax=Rossellomorea marisflavi TaxID=189381 RepID=A0A0M0GRK3_9BACI|nr:flagellar export protein FliJ [Rossellomorea marisflavi]MBV6683252.1 flagellar biosynthesis chaperone FliJ [Bacillus sp. JRC01]KON92107.1 flagellar biosynthesis chaperone [Rossellomorea marisflavi]MCM2588699.1 flagellar biosynthesis chaperone FliJ [Rossellomorea marisflavi]TYS53881.1 flagellar biosynthesis chaperone FliJ [Rossellomorea marisflavi]UTE75124.1 flagellar biosynthesis chaperone FliJ [Rossellomorea marisflavi]
MTYEYRFERILTLKEQEKEDMQEQYKSSVSKFQEAAEQLYGALKKKETLEAMQVEKLSTGLSILDIRHHQQFITNLEKTISYFQNLVVQARNRMNWYEEKMIEMNMEVKKYERLKEKDFKAFLVRLQAEENKQLDEVSVTQYMKQEVR